jgi:hypothetical protein
MAFTWGSYSEWILVERRFVPRGDVSSEVVDSSLLLVFHGGR